MIEPNFNYELEDWSLYISFKDPLKRNIKVWDFQADSKTKGEREVFIVGDFSDSILNNKGKKTQIEFRTAFQNMQGSDYIVCAEFCGYLKNSDIEICDTQITTTAHTTTTTTPTTTTTTTPTTTTTTNPTTPTTTPTTTTPTTTTPTTTTTTTVSYTHLTLPTILLV